MVMLLMFWIGLFQYLKYTTAVNLSCDNEIINDYIQNMFPVVDDTVTKRLPSQAGIKCNVLLYKEWLTFEGSECKTIVRNATYTNKSFCLYNTPIEEIPENAFYSWANLIKLNIMMNTHLTTIQPGAFKGLHQLNLLIIIENFKLNHLKPGVFQGLYNLKFLKITSNAFTKIGHISPALDPISLPGLLKLEISSEMIKSIEKNEFSPLSGSSVKCLNILMTGTMYIEPYAFDNLKNLTDLNLSGNVLNKTTCAKLVSSLTSSGIPLKRLTLRGNPINDDPRMLFNQISLSGVENLDMSGICFGILLQGTFPKMPRLRSLNMSEILVSDLPPNIVDNEMMPNLKELVLSHNRFNGTKQTMAIPSLSLLDLSYNSPTLLFHFSPDHLSGLDSLETLILSGNDFEVLQPHFFTKFQKLKNLHMRFASIHMIEGKPFVNNTELKYLDLSNNNIISLASNTLEGLENLIALDLTQCKIYAIPEGLFVPLKNLKYISLRDNLIKSIPPWSCNQVNILHIIDLSHNPISSWNEKIFKNCFLVLVLKINNCKVTYISPEMISDFQKVKNLHIQENPIICDCYLKKNMQNFQAKKIQKNTSNSLLGKSNICYSPNEYQGASIGKFVDISKTSSNSCYNSNLMNQILIAFSAFFGIVIFSVLFFYFMRWELIYWWYRVKEILSNIFCFNCSRNPNHLGYKYDAFISYSHEDKKFVNKMKAVLEGEFNFTLCVYERDFRVGECITEAVIESISSSRLTIMVLSKAFLKSDWCQWEFEIARQAGKIVKKDKVDFLVVVKLADIDESLMSNALKDLLRTRVYIEWGSSQYKQKIFWRKLKTAIERHK